ncbi:MAG: hypothetical protein NZM04_09985, partial [Methylacidiphilales bacterium]|nr:hypothetical protein [Candidatus Methylacidiphilales bacterium]
MKKFMRNATKLLKLGKKTGATKVGSLAEAASYKQRLDTKQSKLDQWKSDIYNKYMGEMRAHGDDVVRDLEGELRQVLAAGDQDAIQNALLQFQQRYRDYMIGRQRAYQARTVDSMFADPRREQERAQRLVAERELGRNQINEAYRLGLIGNAMQQARRGMLGSSTDVEARGALQTARDAQFMQLESGLQEKARQYRLNDEALRQQLLGMIYTEDPMTAQQFAGMLQGIQQQGEAFREQKATEAQIGQANQLFANQISQS